ncbi:MAG: helix-turn-helix transcriptional regulator [Butyrivibrio sp.]|nr:helix-turn-helix transcriptional regulator [Butyrivibrio sp.]
MYTANFPILNPDNDLFKNVAIANLSYVHAATDPNWSFMTHSHSDTVEISYIFAGQSALYCGDKFYETHPGDLIIKNAKVMHAEKTDLKNPIEQVCIGISGIKLDNLEPNCLIAESDIPIISTGSNKPFFDALFKYILDQSVDTMYVDVSKINKVLQTILTIVYNDFHLDSSKNKITDTGKKDIRPVLRYIEKNYASNLSINNLAKEFFISPFYLSKKFKAETGFTINQYIISCRMGEAERLLIFSDTPIKDIAISCGYDNLPYFYTTFKKYAGCTPQEYQIKYRK